MWPGRDQANWGLPKDGEGWPALSLQELRNLTLCSKVEDVIS